MLRRFFACVSVCALLVGCCSAPCPQSACLVGGPPAGFHHVPAAPGFRGPIRHSTVSSRVWILPQKQAGPGVLMPGPIAVPVAPQPALP